MALEFALFNNFLEGSEAQRFQPQEEGKKQLIKERGEILKSIFLSIEKEVEGKE